MDKLLQWIEKNVKEGTDIEEAKQLVDGLPKLPESREEAEKLIESNRHIKAELDSRISKSVDNAIDRFKENKLPDLIKEERDKLQKELNPEETKEQKELRELREKLEKRDQADAMRKREDELMAKAKELDFDPMKAKIFAAFGDDAEKVLTEFVEDYKSTINSRLEQEMKTRFGNTPPKGGDEPKTKRTEIESLYEKALSEGDGSKALRLKDQLSKLPKSEE